MSKYINKWAGETACAHPGSLMTRVQPLGPISLCKKEMIPQKSFSNLCTYAMANVQRTYFIYNNNKNKFLNIFETKSRTQKNAFCMISFSWGVGMGKVHANGDVYPGNYRDKDWMGKHTGGRSHKTTHLKLQCHSNRYRPTFDQPYH